MNMYQQRASLVISRREGHNLRKLDLIGRVLSLEDEGHSVIVNLGRSINEALIVRFSKGFKDFKSLRNYLSRKNLPPGKRYGVGKIRGAASVKRYGIDIYYLPKGW